MSAKTWVPLAVAVVLGLMAALVARKSLMRSRAAAAPPKNCSVVVAKATIAPGERLSTDQLTLGTIASPTAPPVMFARPSDLDGRVTIVPLVAGQPVLRSFLAPTGSGSGLQALVPSGLRAITLDVSESSGVAGLLIPGCHVDVVATATNQENSDKTVSRTIVQNVPVVAVGQRLAGVRPEGEKDTALSHTVTLLVLPRDAEALDLALTAARLRLVLRGSGDTAETDDDGVLLAELRGNAPGVGFNVSSIFGPPQPVTPTPPVIAPPPATQPAVAAKPDPDEKFERVVTLILGKEERRITFRDDQAKAQSEGDSTEVTDSEATKVPQ